MAGAFIQVTVDDQAILEALAQLQRLGVDLRPVFLDIGKYLERAHRQRCDREVFPDVGYAVRAFFPPRSGTHSVLGFAPIASAIDKLFQSQGWLK